MKSHFRKTLALFCVFALVLVCLTGCSSSNGNNSSSLAIVPESEGFAGGAGGAEWGSKSEDFLASGAIPEDKLVNDAESPAPAGSVNLSAADVEVYGLVATINYQFVDGNKEGFPSLHHVQYVFSTEDNSGLSAAEIAEKLTDALTESLGEPRTTKTSSNGEVVDMPNPLWTSEKNMGDSLGDETMQQIFDDYQSIGAATFKSVDDVKWYYADKWLWEVSVEQAANQVTIEADGGNTVYLRAGANWTHPYVSNK